MDLGGFIIRVHHHILICHEEDNIDNENSLKIFFWQKVDGEISLTFCGLPRTSSSK